MKIAILAGSILIVILIGFWLSSSDESLESVENIGLPSLVSGNLDSTLVSSLPGSADVPISSRSNVSEDPEEVAAFSAFSRRSLDPDLGVSEIVAGLNSEFFNIRKLAFNTGLSKPFEVKVNVIGQSLQSPFEDVMEMALLEIEATYGASRKRMIHGLLSDADTEFFQELLGDFDADFDRDFVDDFLENSSKLLTQQQAEVFINHVYSGSLNRERGREQGSIGEGEVEAAKIDMVQFERWWQSEKLTY